MGYENNVARRQGTDDGFTNTKEFDFSGKSGTYIRRRTMNCPNQEKNKQQCTCPSTSCKRHGVCCECIAYHRKNGGKPGCLG
jgi:hypothetical protein